MPHLKIKDLSPHPINREIYTGEDIDDLVASIGSVGVLEPLVVSKSKTIISGHRRWRACLRLGFDQVPVRVVEVKEDEVPLLIVSHNQYRLKSATEILNELEVVKNHVQLDTAQKGTKIRSVMSDKVGIGEGTIARLLYVKKHKPDTIQMIDDGKLTINHAYKLTKKLLEIEESMENLSSIKKRVRRKKIVEGKNWTIYTKSSQSMEEIQDGSIQTIFTSPPYYKKRDYYHPEQIGLEDSFEDYLENIKPVLKECWRVLKPSGSMFLEYQDAHVQGCLQMLPHRFMMEVLKWDKWFLQNVIAWRKTNSIPQSKTGSRFTPTYSHVFYLTKSKHGKWNEIDVQETAKTNDTGVHMGRVQNKLQPVNHVNSSVYIGTGHRRPVDVLDVCCNGYSPMRDVGIQIAHPATFPPQLVEKPILATTDLDDVVLDPFCGVSSSGVGALSLGRKWIGYELNPKFVDVSRERLNKVGRR